MLWASGALRIGRCSVATHLGYERTLRVFVMTRCGVLWDARFAPPRAAEGPGLTMIYVVLEGRVTWAPPVTLEIGPGTAFLATEEQYDGAGGQRRFGLRSLGEPFRALEIRIESSWALAGSPATPLRLPLGERARGACERIFVDVAASGDGTEATRELLEALAEARILRPELPATVRSDEPPHLTRCWRAAATHFMRMDPAPSLQELADGAGVSLRQLSRDVEEFFAAFPIGLDSFRDLIFDARLRWAVLLLSDPSLPLIDVARAAGYGSVQALGRAFRDAAMHAPGAIRRELTRP